MNRIHAAWESSRLRHALDPFLEDSRVHDRVSRAGFAATAAFVRMWNRSEVALARALCSDRRRVLESFAGLARELRGGVLASADATLDRVAQAADGSVAWRLVRRQASEFSLTDRPARVALVGLAWLVATAVHAGLSLQQYGPGRWPAWAASTAFAVALIAKRQAIADAWTAAHEKPTRTDAAVGRGRVLVITPFPEEGAGYRFRIGHYIPHLVRAGFAVTVAPFFTREFFKVVYRPGNYLRKIAFFCAQTPKRLALIGAAHDYDLLFIYREAFPIGPAVIERALAHPGGPAIVYDFDDAVFLGDTSEANRFASFLKYPAKTATIVRESTCVVAGNEYLAAYARAFNDAVVVIPTCVDTTKFVPCHARPPGPIVVGWVGSPTTIRYLLDYADVLAEVAREHPFVLRIAGAGRAIDIPGVRVENAAWSLEHEVSLFNTCDIGAYPLADDEWTRGKCGFKAIQFMACGVPVVASAVGVNCEIIDDGVNGFLARTRAEWIDRLARLLVDAGLRARFGQEGRRSVEERYSLERNAPLMITTFDRALARASRSRMADSE